MTKHAAKLGIIADSHDNLIQLRKAVKVFNQMDVNLVLHAGDFVAPFALEPIKELKCRWIGVLGNNDGDRKSLIFASQGRIHYSPYDLLMGDTHILLLHQLTDSIVREPFRMVVHGHTHKPEVEMTGGSLLVNPGECCGWLSGNSTIAVVDTETWEAEIHDLPMT